MSSTTQPSLGDLERAAQAWREKCTAIDRKLAELEHKLRNLPAQLQNPEQYHNSLSPPNRLPVELLVHIFDIHVAYVDSNSKNSTLLRLKDCRTDFSWIQLAHVCRLWREVLLNSPHFWSTIIFRTPDLAAFMLKQSKDAPLDVSFDTLFSESPRSNFNLVLFKTLSEAHRLRSLSLSDFSQEAYPSALSNCLPMLEKLILHGSLGFMRNPPTFPERARALIDPSLLRHLEVKELRIPSWKSLPLGPSLTHVVLEPMDTRDLFVTSTDAPHTSPLPSSMDLVDWLRNARFLEHLSLRHYLPEDLCRAILSLSFSPILLPALNKLDLVDAAGSVGAFVQAVQASSSACFAMGLYGREGDDSLLEGFIKDLLACRGVTQDRPTISNLTIYDGSLEGIGSTFDFTSTNFQLALALDGEVYGSYEEPKLGQFIVMVQDYIDFTPLTNLTATLGERSVDRTAWFSLRQLPNLEKIQIDTLDEEFQIHDLITALDPQENEDATSPDLSCDIPFPALAYLGFKNGTFDGEVDRGGIILSLTRYLVLVLNGRPQEHRLEFLEMTHCRGFGRKDRILVGRSVKDLEVLWSEAMPHKYLFMM